MVVQQQPGKNERQASFSAGKSHSMRQITLNDRYVMSYCQTLGSGGFSTVYKALDRKACRNVAIKVYKSDNAQAEEDFLKTIQVIEDIRNATALQDQRRPSFDWKAIEYDFTNAQGERDNMGVLKLDELDVACCFVNIIDYSRDSQTQMPGLDEDAKIYFIIFEAGEETLEESMERHQEDGKTLSVDELRQIQWSMVLMVAGLHRQGYVHMDIKPSNIMRFKNHQRNHGGDMWKLIDLDGAMKSGELVNPRECVCTPLYMPPELAAGYSRKRNPRDSPKLKCKLSRLMDVWSLGICALEAIFLTPVLEPWLQEWGREKFVDWLADIHTDPVLSGDILQYVKDIDPVMTDLLTSMLQKDPSMRFDIAQCLAHEWFAPLREDMWKEIGTNQLSACMSAVSTRASSNPKRSISKLASLTRTLSKGKSSREPSKISLAGSSPTSREPSKTSMQGAAEKRLRSSACSLM